MLANGDIIMNSRPSLGQTFTTTAYCHDRGTWPGPLQSLAPITVSLTTTVSQPTWGAGCRVGQAGLGAGYRVVQPTWGAGYRVGQPA